MSPRRTYDRPPRVSGLAGGGCRDSAGWESRDPISPTREVTIS
jgi:hypothetical protein